MIMSFVLGMYHCLEAVYVSRNISKLKYTNQTSALGMVTCTFLSAATAAPTAPAPRSLWVPTQLWARKIRRAEQDSDWHKPDHFGYGF